jgi:hypothetical protein
MKTNELRLGNLVIYRNQIVKTTGLHYDMFECGCPDDNNWMCTGRLSGVHPIELTEELLVKIGFEGEMYEFCLLADDANITVNLIENRIDISYFGNCEAELLIKYNVKYLHELQNVYYCLTNEELEVNL